MQPSPYWGRGADLDKQGEQSQRYVRPQRARMVCGGGPRSEQSCLLQERLGPSFGESRSRSSARTASLAMLDPKTMKYTFVDTCFKTHHLQFDANDVLWTSGGGQVIGWLDMKIFRRDRRRRESAGLDAA